MSRRARIAEAAVAVLREHGQDFVVYGDVWVLDDIGARAGLPRMHPLNRHKMILDALERSPKEFVKKHGRWSVNNHLCRGFWLTPNASQDSVHNEPAQPSAPMTSRES